MARQRRCDTVVFTDANISHSIAAHLYDLWLHAHWASFYVPNFSKNGNGHPNGNSYHGTENQEKHIIEFFDYLGNRNIIDGNGKPPSRMKDDALVSYMVALIERFYRGRKFYLFYTLDRKFLTQQRMVGHPHISLFREGMITYIPLIIPSKSSSSEVARFISERIRNDFWERLKKEF